MKVLGLVEQDLDIVSKEYVDNKIKEVSKTDDVTPEGYVKIDLLSLWAVYKLNYGINEWYNHDELEFTKLLQKCVTKEKIHLISPSVDFNQESFDDTKILNIIKANPICYIKEADYTNDIAGYLDKAATKGSPKVDTTAVLLWAALKGKGEGNNTKESLYDYIFRQIDGFTARDGKTPVSELQFNGQPMTRDARGLDYLITDNPNLYADLIFYSMGVDDVINAILSGGSTSKHPSLEGYVGLDLIAFTMFLPSKEQCKVMGVTREEIAGMFLEAAVDSAGKDISTKHEYTDLTIEKLGEIALTDPVVYVNKNIFLQALLAVKDIDIPTTTENPQLKDYVKVNIPTLYMISNLIKSNLPQNARLDVAPDDWVLTILSLCVDKDKKDIKTEGKTILELANTVREAYILKSQFDDAITSIIREDFTPIGKKKGYELMKTHYAIYLLSLAHAVKGGTEGLNQKFFKFIKDGYDVNEYDAEKTLVKDLGFTYNESAPESSYSINALSNFADKHPEIYVPTAFTDYVKGTAESTMELFGAVTNLTAFYEDHKNDPKIKIVTPNEYKINRKDPDTLYIVKES
jgi:hypothetical protein